MPSQHHHYSITCMFRHAFSLSPLLRYNSPPSIHHSHRNHRVPRLLRLYHVALVFCRFFSSLFLLQRIAAIIFFVFVFVFHLNFYELYCWRSPSRGGSALFCSFSALSMLSPCSFHALFLPSCTYYRRRELVTVRPFFGIMFFLKTTT